MINNLQLNDFSFYDIKIGDSFSFERVISGEDVDLFSRLTGDFNPLHMDGDYASKAGFNGRVVHGMLLVGFFSAMVGMLCPGKKVLYLSQEVKFIKPLYLDSKVTVERVVVAKFETVKILDLKTSIFDLDRNLIVDGIAKVMMRE